LKPQRGQRAPRASGADDVEGFHGREGIILRATKIPIYQ
jgi:hypothetical protein